FQIANCKLQIENEADMGQKVNPTGFRVGITEDWKSRWYAPKAAYGNFLVEDHKVRKYIDGKLNRRPPFAAVSDIMIERTREEVTITLRTARPGLVIGPKGAEVDKLREELEDLIKRKVAPIKVIEIKNPDLNAQLVAEAIAEQLKKRASFRRVLKQRMEATMQAGAKGIRIGVSGRLGGAEIARQEKAVTGSVPLTTLQADVNYGYAIAFTTYGTIGVKTWIFRGMYGEEVQDTDVRPGGGPRRGRR
ncbi:MAG TPA: 30S ribosomal protein S3, partial [Tepidisphaeraceae bacterium]|nr:30S ribosomal protein S3 [Tepidisphaeraceae bacterium]